MNPVIARLVRREVIGVVENGTGRRLHGGLKLPDGAMVPVAGKTGTGDNEFRIYVAQGGLLGSRVSQSDLRLRVLDWGPLLRNHPCFRAWKGGSQLQVHERASSA